MASQEEEEAVPIVVAPGGVEPDEEVKKVASRGGEFSVNGAPFNQSFNSRISTDVDLAESQVAVAGSVDSAAEVSAVGAGVEEPSARVDHHAGPASSGEVVDATEKVESWDLSEAVQEGSASKEDSKPNFSEDGTAEEIRSSDLMADAPTSAASVEDSAAADAEEKTGEGRSGVDVGGGREVVLPAEVVVNDDGSPKVQDEGSAEKGDSEIPEASVEEAHKVGEATISAEPEKEGESVDVPSPSADIEEKAVAVEDKPVDVADKSVDVEDKPVDVADKSVEVKSAGLVSEELPAESAASEDGSPKILNQGSTGKGDSESPESPVEEISEIATTAVEPDEAVASLESLPSLSADVEDKSVDVQDKPADVEDKPVDVQDKPVDVQDKPVDVQDKPVDVEDKPIDVADKSVDVSPKSVEMNSEDAGVVSEELPAVVAASEEVSPKDEGSVEKGNIEVPEAPVGELQEVAEATPRAASHELGSLEALPSSPVDAEQNSVDLNSADAGAVSEDVGPIIRDEESTEKVDSEATEAPVEDEVHEIAEATSGAEPDEAGSNVEAVHSPSVDIEEKSVVLDSSDAGAVNKDVSPKIKDEESAEEVDSDPPEPLVEEVHEVAEATGGAESAEAGSNVEAVPSPSDDIEEKSVELDSADAGAVNESEDVSPKMKDEESAEKVGSDPPEPLVEEMHEVAEAASGAEPAEAGPNVEAVPSPSDDVEEKSVELDSADAGAVSEDVSPKMKDEESAEKVDGEAPEVSVDDVQEVAEPTSSAEPAEAVASLEAVPSPSIDVEDRSVETHSEDAGAVSEDVSPKIEGEEKVDSEAPDAPVEDEVQEVAETMTTAEPDEAVANLETVPSSSVDVEEKSVELDSADAEALSEDVSPEIDVEEPAEKFDSNAPEPLVEEVHEVTSDTKPDEAGSNVEAVPSPSVDVEEKSFELDSGDAGTVDEDVSPKIEDAESAEKVDSEAPEPLVEEVHEVAEATTGAEPLEEIASSIAVPSPSVDVEEKSFELDSAGAGAVTEDASPKIEDKESTEKVDIKSPEAPVEDEVHEVGGATTSAEPHEAVANVEAVPSPSVDVEEKSVELDSAGAGAVSENVSPKVEDEESAENGDKEAREAPVGEHVHEVAEARTSTEPDEANVEALPSPFVDVEEKSFDLDSEDAGAVSEGVSPEVEAEGSAEKVDREAPEGPVEDVVHELAEATSRAKPDEAVSSLEAVSVPSVDAEDKSFELNSEDAVAVSEDISPIIKDEESTEKVDSEAPEPHEVVSPIIKEESTEKVDSEASEPHEVAEAINGAEPAEEVSSSFSVPSPSVDVEEKSFELDHVDPTTSAEAHEETASQESVSAPAEDVVDKSVQEADSKDTSKASEVLPPENTTDKEEISPEPLAEGNVGSQTLFVPDEEVHEVVEETISAEPGEVPVEPESAFAPSDVEDRSVDLNSGDAIGVTTTSESVDKEGVSPETSSEATIRAGADASLESEGSANLESLSSPAINVEDRSLGVNPEDTSEAKIELDTENTNKDDLSPELFAEGSTDNVRSADKEGLNPDLPTEGSADNLGSESLFTSVEEVHEVIEETISPELDEGSTSLENGPASDDVEEKPENLSDATTTVQPLESVDKELVSRDLPVEEFHAPVEEIGKFEDAPTDEEPRVLESAVASSEDVQSVPETKSREFNFSDLKESLTTSVKEETAIGEEGSSSDAVARDTTPLDVSSPPPADEKKESPNSYDLHEEAVHLEEAAEKTLEDVKSGDKHGSVAESVAQIVLDESSKTGDSLELISGVIQHVAQLAQDDFQSDPNVLPDTVNQVFDGESAGSTANDGSQPKESSSLGTKFSLFVIWCISLCASHVSSKDMPAPALKLGAEEVAAVLHSNSQGAASSKAASSV